MGQTGLNNAFGTTGSGGASILISILIIVFVIFVCMAIALLVYKRMNANVDAITKQLTELQQTSVQSPQSNDASIDMTSVATEGTDAGMPKGTKMGHVQSDESMIMSDMMS